MKEKIIFMLLALYGMMIVILMVYEIRVADAVIRTQESVSMIWTKQHQMDEELARHDSLIVDFTSCGIVEFR